MKAKLIYVIGSIAISCSVHSKVPSFAGYSLPTYNTTWTTPLAVYNYFPVDSDLFIPEHLNASPDIAPANINANISLINGSNLSELDAESFYEMLQNYPHISKEEIRYLWKLLTSNQVDSKVKILFYDFISFENPDYLTNEIIKQAKNEKGELRHKLLVVLQAIYQNNLERNKKTSLKEIRDYFEELQLQDLDKNDGGIIYRGLATLAPTHLNT